MVGHPFSSSSSICSNGGSSSNLYHDSDEDEVDLDEAVIAMLLFLVFLYFLFYEFLPPMVSERTSVLQLQVGLLGTGWSLQKDLDQIAEVADTSTSKGLRFILKETTQALLRHPDYFISGYSSVDVKWNLDKAEKPFKQFSIEERGKFDEITLMNVNNFKRQNTASQKASGFNSEYIVVTILVAAKEVQKWPSINGSGDLKEALEKLSFIPKSGIQAVEVLWTL